ncbi:hypothetical protein PCANC_20940, partial [Puccinia coronata f. sp. avenae]
MRIVAGLIWGFWLASMNHSRQVSGVAIHDHESSTPNYSSYSSQTNGSSSATKHGSSAD